MKLASIIISVMLLFVTQVFAWNDEKTHPDLSEFVAEDFFGSEFMDTIMGDQHARDLIRDGSQYEDTGSIGQFLSGKARSLNHFHNPARATLSEAGLTDLPSVPLMPPMSPGMSTLLWAQDKEAQKNKPQGDWSWNTVRDHQYKYVAALSKTEEDQRLGDMLKGLGFQMHLVQDMGQPNHVRNDTHIWDGASIKLGLETWARVNDMKVKKELLGGMQSIPPVTVDLKPEFKDDAGNTLSPVARLSDTRGYKGERAPRAAFDQGLSEYTNSNYFSESTIFAAERYGDENPQKYYNPYPSKNETSVQDYIDKQMGTTAVQDDDFGVFNAIVISKQNTQGEKLNCVATTGPFTNEQLSQRGPDKYFYGTFMYEPCFPEYATKLIPASAAYSYAMLDYFFRGKLAVTVPADTPPTNKHIRLNIRNSTATDEPMDGGSIELLVIFRQYRKDGTGPNGNLVVDPEFQFRKYTYSNCSRANAVCKIVATDALFDFDLSSNPLPPLTTDISLIVVYRGKLGNEQDAVAYEQIFLDGISGELNLSIPTRGVYASVSGEGISNSFSNLAVSAKSNTGAALGQGNVEMLAVYRTAATDPFQSQQVQITPGIKYASATVNNQQITTTPSDILFNLANTQIPVTATDLYIYVIHTAQDGSVTYGFKDISEPTPVDVYNNADKICINNQWYTAGSTEAITLSDPGSNGIPDLFDPYAHNMANIFVKDSSTTNPTPASATNFTFSSPATLYGGNVRRLGYILTDYSFKYSLLEDWQNVSGDDPWIITETADGYTGTGVKNQTDANGTYTYPGMFTIRGSKMWWGAGVVYDNEAYPTGADADTSCGWSNLQ